MYSNDNFCQFCYIARVPKIIAINHLKNSELQGVLIKVPDHLGTISHPFLEQSKFIVQSPDQFLSPWIAYNKS